MEFRYDFGAKLDLTRFRKSATHYIGSMRELTYNLVLPDYKIVARIIKPDDVSTHLVNIQLHDIKKDEDGNIVQDILISPLIDLRFQENKIIQDLFSSLNSPTGWIAQFQSSSNAETVEKICGIVKLLHKINHLKVFL